MIRAKLCLAGVAASLLVVFAMLPSSASGANLSGRYIVVLKDSVSDPGAVAREHAHADGAAVSHLYSHALKGYAAAIPNARLGAVKADPRVAYVAPDATVSATGGATTSTQVLPSGIDRIDGESSSARSGDGRGAVDLNVAVLDTGIDSTHPDLNVAGGVNCSNGSSYEDLDGHGTNVAGIIGARDNDFGVVGVAPGARLWSVRVLDDNSSGSTSAIICGIDWVAATRSDADPANDIAVANMSLIAKGSDDGDCGLVKKDAMHQAICRATAAGVVFVVAAGNSGADVADGIPASYDEVLTVSAMADLDGAPGGFGAKPPGCGTFQLDDTAASFSNYAVTATDRQHAIAAPGVCVLSTEPSGLKHKTGYVTMPGPGAYNLWTGTSQAAPHVTGTAALCIASGACAGMSPAQVIQKLRSDAAAYNQAHPGYGFAGDPLHSPDPTKYYGYLIRAGLY